MINDIAFKKLAAHGWMRKFIETVKSKNRFTIPDNFKSSLEDTFSKVSRHVKKDINIQKELFRTRINPSHFNEKRVFNKKDMLGPPPHLSKDGRLNPFGIPYVYLSDDKKTAISELRPWVGARLSLATIKLKKKVTVFDFCENKRGVNTTEAVFFNYISELMSTPVYSDDNISYIPTQIIAELIKNMDFEGIIYPSAMESNGRNILIFDKNNLAVESVSIVNVKKVNVEFGDSISENEINEFIFGNIQTR